MNSISSVSYAFDLQWFNVYNTLKVKLQTHDCKGVSDADVFMAYQMDQIFAASYQNNQKDQHKNH